MKVVFLKYSPVIFFFWLSISLGIANSDSSIVLQKLIQIKGQHPRLLINENDLKIMKSSAQNDPLKKRVHDELIKECEAILKLDLVKHEKIGIRLLDKSREALRRIFYLSYGYRITENVQFLRKAEEELINVGNFPDWNPSHFLDAGEMTLAVAIGYDWLYHDLQLSTRILLENAIVEKGITPSYDKRYNWFVSGTNNWNQVCHAGIVLGALAIADKNPELSTRVTLRAIKNVPIAMETYKPNGAYPEGYSYWDYGTSFNVLLIDALDVIFKTDFGLTQIAGFKQTGAFFQNLIGPTQLAHSWGDSGFKARLNPTLFWFAKKNQDLSLLYAQKTFMASTTRDFTKDRLFPALLVWAKDLDLSKITPPKNKIWVGQGLNPVALMRINWEDPNAMFVGVKAGSANVSHAHMDAGSFVIDYKGERWAMDFGMQDYHSLESKGLKIWGLSQNSQRWTIFRYNNYVHNTLTINNALHHAKGYSKIDRYGESKNDIFAITDLSDIFLNQLKYANRGIAIKEGNKVVVRDEVMTTNQETTVRWSFLTDAKVKMKGAHVIELNKNGKTMYLTIKGSTAFILKQWSTVSPNDYDADNGDTVIVGFESSVAPNSKADFTVVFGESVNEKIKVESLNSWK